MIHLLASGGFIDPNNPATWLSAGGTAGLAAAIFIAFVRGWIVPGFVLDRAEKRIQEQNARIEYLTDVFEKQVIPVVTKSTEVNEHVYDYLIGKPKRNPWWH